MSRCSIRATSNSTTTTTRASVPPASLRGAIGAFMTLPRGKGLVRTFIARCIDRGGTKLSGNPRCRQTRDIVEKDGQLSNQVEPTRWKAGFFGRLFSADHGDAPTGLTRRVVAGVGWLLGQN